MAKMVSDCVAQDRLIFQHRVSGDCSRVLSKWHSQSVARQRDAVDAKATANCYLLKCKNSNFANVLKPIADKQLL